MMRLSGDSPEYKFAEKMIKAFDARSFSPDMLALALSEYGGGVIAPMLTFIDLYIANVVNVHQGNLAALTQEDQDAVVRMIEIRKALTQHP